MAEAAASFRTEMFSMSFGSTLLMLDSTPSTMTIALASPIVPIPRTRSTPASEPGCPEVWTMVTPGIWPASILVTVELVRFDSFPASMVATEPVRFTFFWVP